MNIETLSIPDLKLLHLFHSADDRGDFVKTFHAKDFEKYVSEFLILTIILLYLHKLRIGIFFVESRLLVIASAIKSTTSTTRQCYQIAWSSVQNFCQLPKWKSAELSS